MRLETPAVANIARSMETSIEETISFTGGIGDALISMLFMFSSLLLLLLLLLLLSSFIAAPNWVIKELLLNDKDNAGLTISATMRTRPYFRFASVSACAKSSNRSSFFFFSILVGSIRIFSTRAPRPPCPPSSSNIFSSFSPPSPTLLLMPSISLMPLV